MRFYIKPDSINLDKKLIAISDKKEIHHIKDVFRLKSGADVMLFDGKGNDYLGNIKKIDNNIVLIDVKDAYKKAPDKKCSISLYQAIPKRSKMDFIVEKATELGIDKIIPIITDRTEFIKRSTGKLERWQRIAKEASKQCGRSILPEVSEVKSFKDAILEPKASDLKILAALCKDILPLKEILKKARPGNISVFIGPEGDFTDDEVNFAKDNGFFIASLGDLVMRVETAAMYILASINYEYRY